MRPVACFPNSIYSFLIPLALPIGGEMFTAICFAAVPATIRRLPQPSALRLSDLPRQMVADSLTPHVRLMSSMNSCGRLVTSINSWASYIRIPSEDLPGAYRSFHMT